MHTLTITVDDDSARLVAEAARLGQKPVERWVQDVIRQSAACTVHRLRPGAPARRISPLHPGAMAPAPDFNAPLDEFAAYA